MNRRDVKLVALAAIFIPLIPGGSRARFTAQRAAGNAGQAAQLFRQAERLLRQGSLQQAQQTAEKGLQLDPASPDGNDILGLICEREKKYDLSTQAFLRALRAAPRSTQVLNDVGNSYVLQHKVKLAEARFRAALREDPANRNANYNLGLLLLAERRPKEAVSCFERVHPADANSLFSLAEAYLRAGETRQGLATAGLLSGQAKSDVRVHFTLGVMLAANRQYSSAVRELELADALRPGTFEILYDLGQAYLRSSEPAKAEAVLTRAVRLRPQSAEALYLLARADSAERQDLKALDLLIKAHKLAPRNTDVIFLMARISMKQRFYGDAIPLLESGMRVAPNRADLHAALGECYFMVGKIPQSLQEFRTLIKLDPSAASYSFMGLCYRHLGQFERAKEYFQQGLKADPHNSTCLYNMGYIADRQAKYVQAEQWLEQAVRADPKYPDALLELASVKMAEKKFEQALPLLKKCVRLDPRPAAAYYKLATTERDLHEIPAAERDLKIFQTLSRSSDSGSYLYQHLFDYLDRRAGLPVRERSHFDLVQLQQQLKHHPDRPSILYMLSEEYLKLGNLQAAERTIAQLDTASQNDFRTEAGVGVLLARYRLYPQAVDHFQQALKANPNSDGVWYDLADAYFRAQDYSDAYKALERVSSAGRGDSSYLSLLGDVESRLGRTQDAVQILNRVIAANPDKDLNYLSLALVYVRSGDLPQAGHALNAGLARTPDSGWLFWGKGVLAAIEGDPRQAEHYLKESVDLLPQWPGSYSALGVLYYETGQIEKARKTLQEFVANGPQGTLNVRRIEQALSSAAARTPLPLQAVSLPPQARRQFLAVALTLADRAD